MARTRGLLWLFAGVVVALLAAYVAFTTLSQATETPQEPGSGPQVEVVVTTRSLPIRTLLTATDLELSQIPVEALPEGAATSLDDVVGRMTLVDLYAGEAVLPQRLLEPNVVGEDGRLTLFQVEDEVLMAVPAQDLMSKVGVLRPGDQIDVLFSLDFPVERIAGGGGNADEEQSTFALLQNLTIAALVGAASTDVNADTGTGGATGNAPNNTAQPEAILLTVAPQDALVFKYALDAGGRMDVVLRAPGVDKPYETDPVDVDYLINRYDIPAEVGR